VHLIVFHDQDHRHVVSLAHLRQLSILAQRITRVVFSSALARPSGLREPPGSRAKTPGSATLESGAPASLDAATRERLASAPCGFPASPASPASPAFAGVRPVLPRPSPAWLRACSLGWWVRPAYARTLPETQTSKARRP